MKKNSQKDKAATMRKLIESVGTIFLSEGYRGLGVNKVARIAGVHKKLIYRYFGNFESLVEAYVVETDYWMRFAELVRELKVPKNLEETKKLIGQILKNQFLYFSSDREMQELILWELSSNSNLMRSIHRTRELMGQQFLQMADSHLPETRVDFRAIAALLVGGIYYTILHTRHNGGMFSDVDLSGQDGQQRILAAIEKVLDLIFI